MLSIVGDKGAERIEACPRDQKIECALIRFW